MAIKIFLILVISDDLKRVFLGGYYIVLWDRIQIDPETLEKIKYLKNWH